MSRIGMGGPRCERRGVAIDGGLGLDYSEVPVVGITEVLKHCSHYGEQGAMGGCRRTGRRPTLAILPDFPGFH